MASGKAHACGGKGLVSIERHDVKGHVGDRASNFVQVQAKIDEPSGSLGNVDGRGKRTFEVAVDNLSTGLAAHERQHRRRVKHDPAHMDSSAAASRRRSRINSSTRLTPSGT